MKAPRTSHTRLWLDRHKPAILLSLLVAETLLLLWIWQANHALKMTAIPYSAGRSYSLLVDDERLPIDVHHDQEIHIAIFPSHGLHFHWPRRVIIPQYRDQVSRAAVSESRFRFYYDRPEDLRAIYERENLKQCLRSTDWQTILAAMAQVYRELHLGTPIVYPPQDALKILDLMRNHREEVFCAQYCYVTVQFLQALGYFARHITVEGHEVCEAWLPSQKKWVCLDPTHNAYFVNPKGKLLSALEIGRKPASVTIVHPGYHGDLSWLPGSFHRLWFWLTNNLATHPVNIYDLNKYRVKAILEKAQIDRLEPGDLYSVYPEELYAQPSY